eukprot:3849978-Rhodomonas_salina.1
MLPAYALPTSCMRYATMISSYALPTSCTLYAAMPSAYVHNRWPTVSCYALSITCSLRGRALAAT